MSEARKANAEGSGYVITLTVERWINAFTRKELLEELVQYIYCCQCHKGLERLPCHLGRAQGPSISAILPMR